MIARKKKCIIRKILLTRLNIVFASSFGSATNTKRQLICASAEERRGQKLTPALFPLVDFTQLVNVAEVCDNETSSKLKVHLISVVPFFERWVYIDLVAFAFVIQLLASQFNIRFCFIYTVTLPFDSKQGN